ncbi:MAG TPA: hypothetical protein PKK23_20315 [Nitrospirales bacterium]|nr:hypothetical protein [Nitrospirales bacterium]
MRKNFREVSLLNLFDRFLGLRVRDVCTWGQTGIGVERIDAIFQADPPEDIVSHDACF